MGGGIKKPPPGMETAPGHTGPSAGIIRIRFGGRVTPWKTGLTPHNTRGYSLQSPLEGDKYLHEIHS